MKEQKKCFHFFGHPIFQEKLTHYFPILLEKMFPIRRKNMFPIRRKKIRFLLDGFPIEWNFLQENIT